MAHVDETLGHRHRRRASAIRAGIRAASAHDGARPRVKSLATDRQGCWVRGFSLLEKLNEMIHCSSRLRAHASETTRGLLTGCLLWSRLW